MASRSASALAGAESAIAGWRRFALSLGEEDRQMPPDYWIADIAALLSVVPGKYNLLWLKVSNVMRSFSVESYVQWATPDVTRQVDLGISRRRAGLFLERGHVCWLSDGRGDIPPPAPGLVLRCEDHILLLRGFLRPEP